MYVLFFMYLCCVHFSIFICWFFPDQTKRTFLFHQMKNHQPRGCLWNVKVTKNLGCKNKHQHKLVCCRDDGRQSHLKLWPRVSFSPCCFTLVFFCCCELVDFFSSAVFLGVSVVFMYADVLPTSEQLEGFFTLRDDAGVLLDTFSCPCAFFVLFYFSWINSHWDFSGFCFILCDTVQQTSDAINHMTSEVYVKHGFAHYITMVLTFKGHPLRTKKVHVFLNSVWEFF